MALNPLYSSDQLPTTDQAAIREFNDRYIAALGASQPTGWADTLGDLIPTTSPYVTFPVSQLRTQYKRSTGENHFKKLIAKDFSIKTEEFDDGYQAKLKDLFNQSFAYRNWQQAPARFVRAEEQFRADSIAALLELGQSTTCVDGQNFFSTTHPCNMGDSNVGSAWSNYNSATLDVVSITNIAAQCTLGKLVKDENGKKLGVNFDTIIVPSEKSEALKNLLAQAFILSGGTSTSVTSAATSNPYLGRFNVIEAKELTSAVDWYLADSKLIAQGLSPWATLRETVPGALALRTYDESSDFFKDTSDIKMSSHVWYGFGLVFPHAIRLVRGV